VQSDQRRTGMPQRRIVAFAATHLLSPIHEAKDKDFWFATARGE
jgi:hypothetical protein